MAAARNTICGKYIFANMKKIQIKNETFNVEDSVHDLLCFYSRAVQVARLVREAQIKYFNTKDCRHLRRSKALEKKLYGGNYLL